jgi:hypothetical protein
MVPWLLRSDGVWLVKDPGSSSGGSVAAGSTFHAGQVEGDNPDEKWYPGPSWGLGPEDDNLAPLKSWYWENLRGA